MLKVRVIAVVLINEGNVVQTRQFKITNIVGNVKTAVKFFSQWDADEIVLIDISKEPWEGMLHCVETVTDNVLIPVTVGGHIRSMDQMQDLFRAGADKFLVRKHAQENPTFLMACAEKMGTQALVYGMDINAGNADGRGLLGAGEILLNSVQRDGTKLGYNLEAIEAVSQALKIPVIAMGGAGKPEHFPEAVKAGASAVAAGNIFHYMEHATVKAKQALKAAGYPVREANFAQAHEDC